MQDANYVPIFSVDNATSTGVLGAIVNTDPSFRQTSSACRFVARQESASILQLPFDPAQITATFFR